MISTYIATYLPNFKGDRGTPEYVDTVEKQHGPGKLAFPLPFYIVLLTHSSKCPCCAKLRNASLINMHMVSMPS